MSEDTSSSNRSSSGPVGRARAGEVEGLQPKTSSQTPDAEAQANVTQETAPGWLVATLHNRSLFLNGIV